MKKKLYGIGMVMVLCITCIGCGKKEAVTDEVAQVTEAATEEVTEETIEEATKETSKADKDSKKTKQDKENKTDKDNKTQKPDKDTGKQRTTEAASSRTSNSTANSSTGQSSASTTEQPSTRQPSTSAPSTEQPSTRQPSTQTCQHNWVEITETIHHEAEMGERGVTPAVVHHWWCRDCNCSYPEVTDDPCGGINGGTAQIVVQEAVWEQYVVTPAYDETVGTGRYRCSRCGATR